MQSRETSNEIIEIVKVDYNKLKKKRTLIGSSLKYDDSPKTSMSVYKIEVHIENERK